MLLAPEIGTSEVLIIAAIALIVVGPKDLPVLLRKAGQFVGRMRSMAADFRASFDDMARQSELDELRKEVEAMRSAAVETVSIENQALAADIDPVFHDPSFHEYVEPAQTEDIVFTPASPEPALEPAKPAARRAPRKTPDIVEGGPKPRKPRKSPPKDIVT
jgi:sec-independent protein translocase protein TatB